MRTDGNTVSEQNRSSLIRKRIKTKIMVSVRKETVKLAGLKIVQQDESSRGNVQEIKPKILLRTSMTITMITVIIINTTHPFNQSPKWSDTTSVSKHFVRMAEFGSMVGKLVEQQ